MSAREEVNTDSANTRKNVSANLTVLRGIVCSELTKHDALNAIATVTTITYMLCTYDTYIVYYYHYDYNINNHYLYSKSTPFNGLTTFSLLRHYCTRRGVKNKSQKENRAK